MINIAVFASGGGSNAQKILEYFDGHKLIKVSVIITNNNQSGVINIAKKYHIPIEYVSKSILNKSGEVLDLLQKYEIQYIILAGFLLLIPKEIIVHYPDRIINIHPSLLPKYGGKGMYGHFIHEKVKEMGDTESGMTIHLVNEKYDQGRILFQKKCIISPEMSSKEIGETVLKLEHAHYSSVIKSYIEENNYTNTE